MTLADIAELERLLEATKHPAGHAEQYQLRDAFEANAPALLRLARVALEVAEDIDDERHIWPGTGAWADRITQAAKEDQ